MNAHGLDLSVLPIKEEGTEWKLTRPLHPNLPDIASGQFLLIIGKTKCGKSTIINNLYLNKNFLKDQFDTVYVISNTLKNDRSSRFLLEKFPNTCYDRYDEKILENICKYQDSFKNRGDKPRVSVCIDDFVGISASTSSRPYSAWSFCTRFRHYNVGLFIMASQNFRSCPPIARNNCTAVILCRTTNELEIGKMCEEFGEEFGGEKNFRKMFKYATQDQYNFLYLNLAENPPLAFKNFTELLWGKQTKTQPDKYLLESEDSECNEDSDME